MNFFDNFGHFRCFSMMLEFKNLVCLFPRDIRVSTMGSEVIFWGICEVQKIPGPCVFWESG